MTAVTENQETKIRFSKELETIRTFHTGPLKRCSQCGRLVFHPCLACEITCKGPASDPFDTEYTEWDELRMELEGNVQQRYEQVRSQKMMTETASE